MNSNSIVCVKFGEYVHFLALYNPELLQKPDRMTTKPILNRKIELKKCLDRLHYELNIQNLDNMKSIMI